MEEGEQMTQKTQTFRWLGILWLLLSPLVLARCLPVVAFNELTYRPSPEDPYKIWEAYVTDSGMLLLCGQVDNGLESMDRIERVYNLELRLEETLGPATFDTVQVVQVDDDPSLRMFEGYLGDLCQFDEKRASARPNETGWTEIDMDNWDEGFAKIYHADIEAGRLPEPPAEPRVVLYDVLETDPPEYLLMGRLTADGPERKVLLVLGPEHISAMW
jgi:hypothetical protein